MSLKINKNRSNIDNLELQETVEVFIDNINKGLNSFDSLSKSTNSVKDTLYELDFEYKKFIKDMNNKLNMSKYCKWTHYESKD